MAENNNFSAIQIGLASPRRFVNGHMAKSKNLKQSTIVHRSLKKMVYFVKESLVQLRTGNVLVVNIRK